MTRDGKENCFGRFIFEDEQAERIAAGDYSAVWEFMEDNRDFLTGWARKFLRVRFFFLPTAKRLFSKAFSVHSFTLDTAAIFGTGKA